MAEGQPKAAQRRGRRISSSAVSIILIISKSNRQWSNCSAMPTKSREVRLASRPHGEPTLDNFSFATVYLPDPGPGEVLVRNLCMSVDPYMRGRMNEGKSYVPPFVIDKPLEGGAIGRVIESHDEKFPVGSV